MYTKNALEIEALTNQDKAVSNTVKPNGPSNNEPINYLDMSTGDLKSLCCARGLKISGTKFDLVTNLAAYDTAVPTPPEEAIRTYTLKRFERQSRSSLDWNPKCHSG